MRPFQYYCNRIVQEFDLPPWLFGYRYLPIVHPEDYTKRVHSKDETKSTFKIVEPETVIKNALPCNIDNANKLCLKRFENYPFAFSDVPLLEVGPTWIATIYDCYILRYRDEWKNDFYAIVSSDKRSIAYPGVVYRPEHAQSLRRSKLDVLKGFDINKYHPRVIVVENNNRHEHNRIEDYLKSFDFQLRFSVGCNDFYLGRGDKGVFVE